MEKCKNCCCQGSAKEETKFFVCQKCGIHTVWHGCDFNASHVQNQCHTLQSGRAGYGSKLDGCEITIMVCDECLVEWISTFKLKNEIYNSGSNLQWVDGDLNEG